MRIMAIDWGEVRLGIALSDPLGVIASPREPIKRKGIENDMNEIMRIVSEEGVTEMVIGAPLDMDGAEGKSALMVKDFVESLRKRFHGVIHMADERYSSHAAERALLEGNVSRKKRKQLRDGVAAAWILQGFLDGRAR